MRKTTTLLLSFLFFTAVAANAQVWLELGLKGMMGMTGFYNKNIANDASHDQQIGLATSVGGVAALNIGDYHGLNFELLSGTHHQSMSYRGGDGMNNTVNMEWKGVDMYLLYRWYRDNGAFLEAGPKITYINQAQQSFGTNWEDSSPQYADSYYSIAFGVGGFVSASKVLTVKTGLRAEYAMTDLISADGKAAGYPAFYTAYDSYTESRPFRAGFYLEVTFGVGGLAQAQCGRRGLMFGTRY